MQGSFTAESASKFLELMKEAGYDARDISLEGERENFSGGVSRRVDPWAGNVAEFGEVRGEYIENYDYTRCVRPDGSSYGSRGKCRKGTPTSAKSETKSSKTSKQAKEVTPDEKWMQDRLATLRTLKGKSKQELLSILNQHRRIHGLTEKDSVRDLQGAILGSIHGNDSPTEIKEKRAARLAQIQRNREAQKDRDEEQSAIDQLSQMLPKGENIMDSLGSISIATGREK